MDETTDVKVLLATLNVPKIAGAVGFFASGNIAYLAPLPLPTGSIAFSPYISQMNDLCLDFLGGGKCFFIPSCFRWSVWLLLFDSLLFSSAYWYLCGSIGLWRAGYLGCGLRFLFRRLGARYRDVVVCISHMFRRLALPPQPVHQSYPHPL